jgi:hypothetical protein
VHIVAEGGESAETNEFNGRAGNIVDQHSEVRATNMSGIDDTSVSAGDRDGSEEFDRVEEVIDIIGAGERRTGIDHPGSESWSIGDWFFSCSCSCSGEGVVLGLHVAVQGVSITSCRWRDKSVSVCNFVINLSSEKYSLGFL